MSEEKILEQSSNIVRKWWEKHGIQKPFRFLGFCLSLIPLNIISRVGQVIEKHIENIENRKELDQIWAKIKELRPEIDSATSNEESIRGIAQLVKSNAEIMRMTEKYIKDLYPNNIELLIITRGASLQEFIRNKIDANIFVVDTAGGSQTLISGTTVNADKITLKATGDSCNTFVDTTFSGKNGSVKFNNIDVGGHVEVEDSKVATLAKGPGGGSVKEGQILGEIGFGPGGARIGVPLCPQCNSPLFSTTNGKLCKRCNVIYR